MAAPLACPILFTGHTNTYEGNQTPIYTLIIVLSKNGCLCSDSLAYCVIRLADRPLCLPHTATLFRGVFLLFLFIEKPPWKSFQIQ